MLWQGSGVERSGAAQGLAEVLAVLGEEYLEGLLPDILAGCASRSAEAREGHLTLFKFLPLAIPEEFQVCCRPTCSSVLSCKSAAQTEETSWYSQLNWRVTTLRVGSC